MERYLRKSLRVTAPAHTDAFHYVSSQRIENGDFTENYSLSKVNVNKWVRQEKLMNFVLEQSFANFLNIAVNQILRIRKWSVTTAVKGDTYPWTEVTPWKTFLPE